MPTTGGGGTSPTGVNRQKVTVFLGLARVKRTTGGTTDRVQVPVLCNVRKYIQEKLNLPLATAAQLEQARGDKTIYYDGCFHGKTVVIPSPLNEKTAKGKIKTYSFPVPGYASRKVLNEAFGPTKVERWKFQGGRSRSVPGKSA